VSLLAAAVAHTSVDDVLLVTVGAQPMAELQKLVVTVAVVEPAASWLGNQYRIMSKK